MGKPDHLHSHLLKKILNNVEPTEDVYRVLCGPHVLTFIHNDLLKIFFAPMCLAWICEQRRLYCLV
jgi:hypothetical protein